MKGPRPSTCLAVPVVPLVAALLAAVMATPAHASCAADPEEAIDNKQTVFVATAVEQRHPYARVEIKEIWRGPDLAPSVWLQTTPVQAPSWPLNLVSRTYTSVDADLVPGTRYLIATEEGGFRTNNCLVAEASDPFVDRLAPDVTREPVASGQTGMEPSSLDGPIGIALAVALIALVAAGIWLAYRRVRSGTAARRQ